MYVRQTHVHLIIPCSLELISQDILFFTHNKTVSAGLSRKKHQPYKLHMIRILIRQQNSMTMNDKRVRSIDNH